MKSLTDILFWFVMLILFGGNDLLNFIQAVRGDYTPTQQEQKKEVKEAPKKNESKDDIKTDW